MDYGKTLNLPKTDFPMRANLPQREPQFSEFWKTNDIYNKDLESKKGSPSFILHDGPPYANGDIHLGHTLNKVLKDIIVKYKSMQGFYAPYVPGWDTHGLPIEQQAIKKLGLKKQQDPIEFRNACKEFALKYVNNQREQFKRLGVRADWENPYLTLKPEFEAKQIEIFGEMAKKGYIYKGLKPVYWSVGAETALAEAEIEYQEVTSNSIYVKFKVKEDQGKFTSFVSDVSKIHFVIWTTTTWTLPANVAICLGPEFEYSLIQAGDEYYVMATDLLQEPLQLAGIEEYTTLATFTGKELEGIQCVHPLYDRTSLVIVGEHVTLESGTGAVHTAPGHGQDDFIVGQKYGLEVLNPVDNRGCFTEKAGKYAGQFYQKAIPVILEDLVNAEALLAQQKITHQYPHCWRTKTPILFRATEQWFASVEGFKELAVEEIHKVKWVPAWGEERIANMVQDRQDWCISRQRIWGVPIPIFYCTKCNKEHITDESIHAVKELFAKEGSDAWWKYDASTILPEGTTCECGHNEFTKEMDIMDVWFDSGSSHSGVLETYKELSFPADLYLEGNDQYRGWFQSSLLTSVAAKGQAPYKTVLTHGFVVDGQGRKMSKSLGNGIDPQDIIKQFGADVLRLWVISADYKTDVRISNEILKQLSEGYRKIRNTARYMISNMFDYNPDQHEVSYENLTEIDKWALTQLNKLIAKVTKAFETYEYHLVYHAIHQFCVVDMSNFYLDIIKDRLYVNKADDVCRRSAQTVMYSILDALVRMITPILAFTSEEIWQAMPHKEADKALSVQMVSWPTENSQYENAELEEKWETIKGLRSCVSKALEIARNNKLIGNSLEAALTVYADEAQVDFINSNIELLETVFIVSDFKLDLFTQMSEGAFVDEEYPGLGIVVTKASGEKCERCWMYKDSVGTVAEHPSICKRCADVLM